MAKNVHIVPHMHWDREWYFTTEESRILLVNNMEEIMDMLENNPNYPYYVLDGQTAILEDYFDVKPENRERVKKLVQEGKFIIGPWYTQTDEMVVGAESITRNLLYGIKDCKEFGEPMMIGYLPDSFGQSEKLPEILNGFNITRCIFWRGSSERHGTNKQNFKWCGETSGEVLVQLLPMGYAIGKYLPVEFDALKKRLDKFFPVLDSGTITDDILFPNGHDQMPIQKNIFEIMDQMKNIYPDRNYFLSKYENVFEVLEKVDTMDTIKGELLDGKYMRVHRSIFSTRADIKSANTRIENKITNVLEPLASIAYSLGASYEEGLIEAIWKEIMKNHAHDSIGCCCSDKVHQAIVNRFFTAEDKTDELIRYYKRKIVDAISCDITLDKLTAFNFLPYERNTMVEAEIITKMKNFKLVDENNTEYEFDLISKEIVDAGLIDRQIVHYGDYDPFVKYTITIADTLPSMGYKTYLIKEIEGTLDIPEMYIQSEQSNEVSSGISYCGKFYKINITQNGSLEIYDKVNDITYKDVLLIEDGSDDGDEYDFSPLEDDFIVTSKDVTAKKIVKSFKHHTDILVNFEMNVPKDLDSRKSKQCDATLKFNISIRIREDCPIIRLNIDVDNTACDHRVRVLVPNGLSSNFSISDNQFGNIKRPVYDSAMDVWEKEGWDERPDSIYPMLSYVALDNNKGMAVLTNSVREFEVISYKEKYDTIAITLFRSIGFLGKEELFRRPGRPSGIKLPTPDSQLLGKQSFQLALAPNCSRLEMLAKAYITPVETYNKMPYNAMKLNTPSFVSPYSYSLLNDPNKSFVLSALKKQQDKDGLILRIYQTQQSEAITDLEVYHGKNVVAEVNLAENIINPQKNNLVLPNNVVKSFLIK
ncbi:alpha-mannosidase [Candidatus Epulonipiscium fishelsonii]|uniref:Alpha-mannosidase n=1 Tax=Candidatus Epulonipiscium fishelsonii TaxID=77094 RepID=A0ACC8X985_9FIRM|nr:alpha-mannosidase [Epulopiscium sp. SCG-B11WGA-EpuloA1]ONI39017.1 alpha-mannosidase [Epulopiscium sp. SCG-B05WGA-EpuloA1]